MLKLYDIVRLKTTNKQLGLSTKCIGTIVDVLNDGKAFTVEFIDDFGNTVEEALFTEFAPEELVKVPFDDPV